jgi:hypothetical protein
LGCEGFWAHLGMVAELADAIVFVGFDTVKLIQDKFSVEGTGIFHCL